MDLKYIDAHSHIYPDRIAMKAAQSTADFYEMDMACDGRLSTLLEHGEAAGIEKHMVLGVAVTPDRVEGINNYLIRTVRENKDRLIGFGSMDPNLPDVRSELRRIKAAGLVGVKVHADFQKVFLDSDSMIDVFRILAEENMPAVLHMGDTRHPYSEPERLEKALKAVPDVKVIAAHIGGWTVWEDAWKHLAHLDNVWVDTSSSLYAFTPETGTEAIRRYRTDRVVFATDFPMWDPIIERQRFDALSLTEDERRMIGRENIENFLKQFGA